MTKKTPVTSTEIGKAAAVRQLLFVQGGGEGAHAEWDDKLLADLKSKLGAGFHLHYPRMPNEADPSFEAWSAKIAGQIALLSNGSILVGHSIGGTILLHTLARQPRLLAPIAAIHVLATPYVGDGGWQSDEIVSGPDWSKPLAGVPIYLYQGDADETTPASHLDLYAEAIPHAKTRRLAGRDHQLNGDLSEVARDILGARLPGRPECRRR